MVVEAALDPHNQIQLLNQSLELNMDRSKMILQELFDQMNA